MTPQARFKCSLRDATFAILTRLTDRASISMHGHQIAAIARFTVIEAWRTRLLLLYAVLLGLILGAAYFLQQLAITESIRLQLAFSAAAIRLASVCVLCLHVSTSVTREFNDKGLELTLSFDLPRSHYILGRLAGFLIVAVLLAMMATLPQLLLAPAPAALLWGASLVLELAIVAALSLFCVVTFTQLMPAASFVCGFYLLARALTALRLMSSAPLASADTLTHQLIGVLIDTLALLLPALDDFAQSAWLIEGTANWAVLGANAAQAGLYIALLGAATMFDFYRKNL